MLTTLCDGSRSSSLPPGSGDEPSDSVEEALGIFCGLLGSCAQHVLSPRCRLACIGMMELLVPFSSQDTILEQIVPYSHVLMTDPVAKVRAKALQVLGCALTAVVLASLAAEKSYVGAEGLMAKRRGRAVHMGQLDVMVPTVFSS
ncbi:unnamed protein product [Symbiodinium sp. CCMP2592]|nr:unnamed protein product [Symbiodinium sp. CCMP2592]